MGSNWIDLGLALGLLPVGRGCPGPSAWPVVGWSAANWWICCRALAAATAQP